MEGGEMKGGKLNILIGGLALLLGGIGGFFLGFSMDGHFTEGFYAMPYTRALLKGAHTHIMPLAIYNLIIGTLLSRLVLSDKQKRILSISGACSLIMALGLLLRGLDGGKMTFAPVVMIGVLGLFVSAVLIVKGALGEESKTS